jgi:hypothetical protein
MTTSRDMGMRALADNEIAAVAGGVEFNVLGVHFNYKDLGYVQVTWQDGRETWLGWNYRG